MDAVYFMEGWDKARRCRIEYEACTFYGKITINAEWRELKKTFSIEQTIFECFPDQMDDPQESVEQVANRIIRLCQIKCNGKDQSWEIYTNLRKEVDMMQIFILSLLGVITMMSIYKIL